MSQTVKKTSFLAGNNDKPSSFSKASSTIFSFCSRQREQKQAEIIVEISALSTSSSSSDNNSLHHRRRDSDCELAGLQLLAEDNDNNYEDDNWDELSLDYEEDEYSSSNYSTTMPPSLPPIQSPTSVMTKKLHPLSRDKLFL